MLHEITIDGYLAGEMRLFLGTAGSYGREQLKLHFSPEWDGMAIAVTFVTKEGATQIMAGKDRVVNVPAEATANPVQEGVIVIKGIAEDARQYTVNIPYFVLDHAEDAGVEPLPPTPSQIEQLMLLTQQAIDTAEDALYPDNQLSWPYASGQRLTDHGVTFTLNADGSVTANGTAADTARYFFTQRQSHPQVLTKGQIYTLSGCPRGGEGAYRLYMTHTENGQSVTDGSDTGEGYTFTADDTTCGIFIWIQGGTVCENLTFYPMLALGSRVHAYQPPMHSRAWLASQVQQLTGDLPGVVEIANSYYKNRDQLLYAKVRTPLDSGFNPAVPNIDCSCFAILCLMGINYENSPYCGHPLAVGEATWAYDLHGCGVRTSEEICDFLTKAGCRIRWDKKISPTLADFDRIHLQPGDFIFYARKNPDGTWVQPDRETHISHVAMVIAAVPSVRYTLLEVTSTSTVVPSFDLASRSSDIYAICRPDYTARAYGRYLNIT